MESLHNIYFENTDDDSTHTEIQFDLAYTSFVLIKNVRTGMLIRGHEEGYENALFNDDPSTNASCSLCGRTDSKDEISGTIQSTIDDEEPEHRNIHLCHHCSELIQDKLSLKLKEHYPTKLTLKTL